MCRKNLICLSPGNDHDTTITQNSEPVRSKRNNHKDKEPTTSEDKITISILGDSMVKHVEEWKLSKNVDRMHKVYVRNFSSAKLKCMKDYVKLCIRENNPDHVIIYVGTNELDSERQAVMIAKSIIDVANIRANTHTVSRSGIVPRNDNFNNKELGVNDELAKMCREAKL